MKWNCLFIVFFWIIDAQSIKTIEDTNRIPVRQSDIPNNINMDGSIQDSQTQSPMNNEYKITPVDLKENVHTLERYVEEI